MAKQSYEAATAAAAVRDKAQADLTAKRRAEEWVDERVEAKLHSAMTEHGVNRPNLGNPDSQASPSTQVVNRQIASTSRSPGRALDEKWRGKNLGEFVAAISPTALSVRNDYSSLEPSSGGFLVPEILRIGVAETALEASIIRKYATIFPMVSSNIAIPVVDETSRASTVFGGISGAWTEEGGVLAESEATFGRVRLQASKLTTRCDVPNELLEDSGGAMNAFLQSRLPQAIAWFEDTAFLTGNGVGQPLGVLNSPALVSVAKEAGQPADTLVWENIVHMAERLFPSSWDRAVWIANPDTFMELATMALSVGTGGSAIWLNSGQGSAPTSILGRPLIFSEKMKTLGDEGDLLLADLSHYYIGDKGELRLEASPHALFTTDMVCYRCVQRVDGRSGILSAVTPQNSTDELSAFVTLAER